jgi:putative molybdopterin biosynthesis protein
MACPGYPVSAAVAFDELARALIASLEGVAAPRRAIAAARLAADVRPKRGARALLRVSVGIVDGRRIAMPLRGGASVLTSLVHADALLPTPPGLEAIEAATRVMLEPLRGTCERGSALLLAGAPEQALELLALTFAEQQGPDIRMALCEISPAAAVALVRERMCHAATVARVGSFAPSDELLRVPLTSCKVGLVSPPGRPAERDPRQALRGRVRIAAGPQSTPARHILDDVMRRLAAPAPEIVEARSDAVALATLATGCADFAVSSGPAADKAGLATSTLGSAGLDLVIERGVAERDPLARALLQTVRSAGFALALEQAGYEPRVAPALCLMARAGRTGNVKSTPEVSS